MNQKKQQELQRLEKGYQEWEDDADKATKPTCIMVQSQHLWDQYKYRHELIWSLIFRFTTAVVALSVIPYTISFKPSEFTTLFRLLVVAPPLIAVGLGLLGISRIVKELWLLEHVRRLFWPVQDLLFFDYYKYRPKTFSRDVQIYLWGFFALACLNALFIEVFWILGIDMKST